MEVFPGYLVLLAEEVIGTYCEPADRMRGVVLNQIMGAVVEVSDEVEVEEAGGVYGEDLEAKGVFLDGFEAELVGRGDLVVLVESLGLDAENVDVLSADQCFENSIFFPLFFHMC